MVYFQDFPTLDIAIVGFRPDSIFKIIGAGWLFLYILNIDSFPKWKWAEN